MLLRELGLAYEQAGDFKKAVAAYRKGMGVGAANVSVVTLLRKNLAHALLLDGQIDPAEKEYRTILEIEPG